MDLLSAVAHELGLLVGLAKLPSERHAGDRMGASLSTGTRRTPTVADVQQTAADALRPAETTATPTPPVRRKAVRRR
jgi:hypothetical protein